MTKHRCYGCMTLIEENICPHCGYSSSEKNDYVHLPAGTLLRGQYLVGRNLGQNYCRITYLGWDQRRNLPVAVKELYPGSYASRGSIRNSDIHTVHWYETDSFSAFRDYFLHEAEVLQKLRGISQVADVYDVFEDNGTAYIVTEYFRGRTLYDYVTMKGGKLSIEETLRLVDPLFDALSAAHSRNIVHRNICPHNILLHPETGAKLLDFDVCQADDIPELRRDPDTSRPIPDYFSPLERYLSQDQFGPEGDEYALCATIYYCLAGKPPQEHINRIDQDEVGWTAISGLTARQQIVLKKGMSLAPRDRYGDLAKLKARLHSSPDNPLLPEEKALKKRRRLFAIHTPTRRP